METPEVDASFAVLNEFVYRTYHHIAINHDGSLSKEEKELWKAMQEKPIDRPGLVDLKSSGWKMVFEDDDRISSCSFFSKLITISELDQYERDKTICHELVHAFYGECSIDYSVFGASDIVERRNNRIN